MRGWLTLVLGVTAVVVVGCGERCVPGKTEDCACSDGRTGAQVCRATGTFDPCVCTGRMDGGVDGGSVDAGRLYNNPPQVNPIPDISMTTGDTMYLETTVRDADSDPLTLTWRVVSGPSTNPAVLVDVDGPGASFTPDADGRWRLALEVSDGLSSASTEFEVQVVEGHRIDAWVSGIAYVAATHRLVVVSEQPRRLTVYDPDTFAELASVELARVPKALSVSPDGAQAMVAHDGLVTAVSLDTTPLRAVQWPVTFEVSGVASMGGLGWVAGPYDVRAFRPDAGLGPSVLAQTQARHLVLHSSGARLYVATSSQLTRYAVRAGGVLGHDGAFTSYSYTCSGLWSAPVSDVLVDGCGGVLRLASFPGDDLQYGGRLPRQTLRWTSEASDGRHFAAITSSFTPAHLVLFDLPALEELADVPLPNRIGLLNGELEARFVFIDKNNLVHVLARGERGAPAGRSVWMRFHLF